jgi:O-antigen/teichoic acid export membrane protein
MANEPKQAPAERRSLLWIGESTRLLLNLTVLALLSHAVGPEVLGTYLSVTSLALLAPRLLDAGLPHALGYFLRIEPRSLRSGTAVLARHVALAAPVAIGVAYLLRYVPFASESAARLTVDHWLELSLFIVSELAILLGLSSYIPTARFRAYLVTTTLPPLLFLAGLQLWPGNRLGAGQLLSLLLASSLAGSIAMTAMLAWATRRASLQPFPTREAYAYGLQSYGSAVGKIAAQRFDRLFLVTVLGAAGYAQYSLAISVRDMAVFPANLYAMTLRNRQIDLVARQGDLGGARRVLTRVSLAWLAAGLVGAAVMVPLWPALVRFSLGTSFLPTADFLQVVAFSCGPIAIMGFAWSHLNAMRMPGRVTALTVGSLALAIPTFFLFIHHLGPTRGVAFAVVAWSCLTAAASLAWALSSRPPEVSTK